MPAVAPTAWYSLKTMRAGSSGCARSRTASGRGEATAGGVLGLAQRLEEGGVEVDQRDRGLDLLAGGDAVARHDQRDRGRLVVHHGLAPEAAVAEVVAVVGGVDHPRGRGEAGLLQRAEQLADVVVEERDHAVVGGERHAGLLVVEEVGVVHAGAQALEDRVVGALASASAGQRDLVERVEVEELRAARPAGSGAGRSRRTAARACSGGVARRGPRARCATRRRCWRRSACSEDEPRPASRGEAPDVAALGRARGARGPAGRRCRRRRGAC